MFWSKCRLEYGEHTAALWVKGFGEVISSQSADFPTDVADTSEQRWSQAHVLGILQTVLRADRLSKLLPSSPCSQVKESGSEFPLHF